MTRNTSTTVYHHRDVSSIGSRQIFWCNRFVKLQGTIYEKIYLATIRYGSFRTLFGSLLCNQTI
ncbi:hypothetical protein Pmar_PMAR022415 [Perkinsus marinus ATCC 50983]|uniref:Uncharacterized protein n=1 Tax=Perkinsus marinus (strain ATCC 50983 / TXsc) TaxID=423536 RepID=C5LJS0_PERM5|nr:hypothetical protein Pmar_PMAR022415 [Perkinsus marinus ATCC 50983]EER03025.1 hypothetical protein Pmar_PMAR022415 [Perkinsus marinus ATCC 50983]|eukprot:XP_002771209.1 hypothetical protein Pmar_PMAR022415 [Perkinsus marinus ATCC 50983]